MAGISGSNSCLNFGIYDMIFFTDSAADFSSSQKLSTRRDVRDLVVLKLSSLEP